MSGFTFLTINHCRQPQSCLQNTFYAAAAPVVYPSWPPGVQGGLISCSMCQMELAYFPNGDQIWISHGEVFTSVPCPYLSSLSPSGGGFCPLSKVRYQRFITSRNFALALCRVILTFERKFNSKESHFLNIISLLHHNNSACSFPSLKIKQSRSSFILVESNSSFVHLYDTRCMQTSSYCSYNYSILTTRRLLRCSVQSQRKPRPNQMTLISRGYWDSSYWGRDWLGSRIIFLNQEKSEWASPKWSLQAKISSSSSQIHRLRKLNISFARLWTGHTLLVSTMLWSIPQSTFTAWCRHRAQGCVPPSPHIPSKCSPFLLRPRPLVQKRQERWSQLD